MNGESLDALVLASGPDDVLSGEDGTDFEEEPPLSSREQLAKYLRRGAFLGILFPPIEFYVLYLVIKVFVSDEPLARYRNMSLVAAVIMLIVLGGWYAVIRPG